MDKYIKQTAAAFVHPALSSREIDAPQFQLTNVHQLLAQFGMEILVFAVLATQLLECNVLVRDWLSTLLSVIDVSLNLTPPSAMVSADAIMDSFKLVDNAFSQQVLPLAA